MKGYVIRDGRGRCYRRGQAGKTLWVASLADATVFQTHEAACELNNIFRVQEVRAQVHAFTWASGQPELFT